MGGLVADGYVPHVQEQLNSRFIGEALDEMVQFQKEFEVFSPQHTLQMSFGLLNIAPVGEADRRGFFRYLKLLKGTLASSTARSHARTGTPRLSPPCRIISRAGAARCRCFSPGTPASARKASC